MTRAESTFMKGIAILLMLWLHLFNRPGNVALCDNTFGQADAAHFLTGVCNPIFLFMVLSGYGLYCIHKSGKGLSIWKRVTRLFSKYWITLALFLLLASLVIEGYGLGNPVNFMLNVTGLRPNYNGETWFILPYVLFVALAPLCFRLLDRYKYFVLVGAFMTLAMLALIHFVDAWFYSNKWRYAFIYTPVLAIMLAGAGIMGAWLAKYDLVTKCKTIFANRQILLMAILLALVALRLISPVNNIHIFYVTAMLPLTLSLHFPVTLVTTLTKIGAHSTTMWLSHTWFCYYIFHDETYALRYPVVIFTTLVLMSFASAWVIDHIEKAVGKVGTKIFKGR